LLLPLGLAKQQPPGVDGVGCGSCGYGLGGRSGSGLGNGLGSSGSLSRCSKGGLAVGDWTGQAGRVLAILGEVVDDLDLFGADFLGGDDLGQVGTPTKLASSFKAAGFSRLDALFGGGCEGLVGGAKQGEGGD
jgi:hypothetical protein